MARKITWGRMITTRVEHREHVDGYKEVIVPQGSIGYVQSRDKAGYCVVFFKGIGHVHMSVDQFNERIE
jgi:hypothetical protein